MERAVLVDANIPLFALGAAGRLRDAARGYLSGFAEGEARGYASTEMIQEVVFHRLRRTGNRQLAVREGRALAATLTILKFDYEVLDESFRLMETLPHVRGRDAIHAATALAYGIPAIVSADAGFDRIPGLTRIDPIGLVRSSEVLDEQIVENRDSWE